MLLGIFLLKDTICQLQDTETVLQMNQMSLNAKYNRAELCEILLKSLSVIARSYLDTEGKLLCIPNHWMAGITEEAVSQDPLLSDMTPMELGLAVKVSLIVACTNDSLEQKIHEDKLYGFDILNELKNFIQANYEVLQNLKASSIKSSLADIVGL